MSVWTKEETSTHQDHVIAHVLGTSVLGYFVLDEAAHLLLDIGFVWTILLDGEMGMVPLSMAMAELETDAQTKAELLVQTQQLYADGPGATHLSSVTPVPLECLITGVSFYAYDERRRVVLECEAASLVIETSLATGEIGITALAGEAA